MLTFDMQDASSSSLPTARSDLSRAFATAESLPIFFEDAAGDVADAMAIMSSIEGLSGFFCTGYRPAELVRQPAQAAGEHTVSATPPAFTEERK